MLIALNLKALISSEGMMWLIISAIIISVIAAFVIPPHQFKKSRISVFVSLLASIAVLFIGLSLLISSMALEKGEATDRANFTKQAIDKLWLYPNQLLVNSKEASDEFLKSLYYNNESLYKSPNSNKKHSIQTVLEEQNISIVLIQAWEDFLTLRKFDETGDEVWLMNFIQWAQSPYLRNYFNFLKYNFKDTTIQLGELLFEYAATLPVPSADPELYRSTVQKMLKDKRVIDLLKKATLE